jgi:hypothetical protein
VTTAEWKKWKCELNGSDWKSEARIEEKQEKVNSER